MNFLRVKVIYQEAKTIDNCDHWNQIIWNFPINFDVDPSDLVTVERTVLENDLLPIIINMRKTAEQADYYFDWKIVSIKYIIDGGNELITSDKN